MKKAKFFSLLFILCGLFTKCIASDINSACYNIETRLAGTSLDISATLEFKTLPRDSSNQVKFLFNSKNEIKSVTQFNGSAWVEALYSLDENNNLIINSPAVLSDSGGCKLKFEYSYPLEALNDTVLILDRGHRWYPLISNRIFSFKHTVSVPEKYCVLSAGKLMEEVHENNTSVYIWESASPVFKLPLILYNPVIYARASLPSGERKLILYTINRDTPVAVKTLKQIDSILNYYSDTIGPYNYDKLILFETEGFMGINVGSGILTIGKESLDMIEKGYKDGLLLTAAQQWFGATVFADFNKPGFFFISLSLPHYLRLMYLNYSEGEKEFEKALLNPMARYKEFAGTEKDIPIIKIDKPDSKEKSIILYAKGPYILNKIHKKMGDESWVPFLRNLYASSRGKIITFETFADCLAKYDATGGAKNLLLKLVNKKGIE